MKLSQLLKTDPGLENRDSVTGADLPRPEVTLDKDPDIGSIHYRAQEVVPGGLFVAIPGLTVDGHTFIDEAVRRGAVAVATQRPAHTDAIQVQVPDTRKFLAQAAARFYQNPSEKLCLIGITGTNGKTTTSFLIESILTAAGYQVGVIGTVDYRFAGKHHDNPVTTPESLDLQRILAQMLQAGVSHVVLEVSSHAVDLHRVYGCRFDIGIFTNLTRDHLDYHGDMENYWSCKKRFFTEHLSRGPKKDEAVAIVCADHQQGEELLASLEIKTVSVGTSKTCQVKPQAPAIDLSGIVTEIDLPGGSFQLQSSLIGVHNLENILCAAGAGFALGIPSAIIAKGIERLRRVPGRLERIENRIGRFVFVDYAHTPDALKNVLSALRLTSENRIICIFGCGGDRDRGKRPLMGEIAGRLCDLSIVTSDNPRTEEPNQIITEILGGLRRTSVVEFSKAGIKTGFGKKGFVVEPDRREAIRLGVFVSQPGDILLIAGKGHETYQIIGKQKRSFDDRVEARQALSELEQSPLKQEESNRF